MAMTEHSEFINLNLFYQSCPRGSFDNEGFPDFCILDEQIFCLVDCPIIFVSISCNSHLSNQVFGVLLWYSSEVCIYHKMGTSKFAIRSHIEIGVRMQFFTKRYDCSYLKARSLILLLDKEFDKTLSVTHSERFSSFGIRQAAQWNSARLSATVSA